ncbi:hypothetical protein ACQPW1_25075 [Nocardia sp. CA-128927]|uniref:hypothetical protein n=1 Tax=Nocardia sp. CA-128927 TaxID=3239975 RepID=UPI003D96A0D5
MPHGRIAEAAEISIGSLYQYYPRILIEQAPRSSHLMDKATELQRTAVADMRELLTEHPDVNVDDRHAAARLVVTTIELLAHHLLAAPKPLEVTVFENELVAMLTRYLTAAPKTT